MCFSIAMFEYQKVDSNTHTQRCIVIYIYVYVCVCACVYRHRERERAEPVLFGVYTWHVVYIHIYSHTHHIPIGSILWAFPVGLKPSWQLVCTTWQMVEETLVSTRFPTGVGHRLKCPCQRTWKGWTQTCWTYCWQNFEPWRIPNASCFSRGNHQAEKKTWTPRARCPHCGRPLLLVLPWWLLPLHLPSKSGWQGNWCWFILTSDFKMSYWSIGIDYRNISFP